MAPRLCDIVPAVGPAARPWEPLPVVSRFLTSARHDLRRSKNVLAEVAGDDVQSPWPMERPWVCDARVAARKDKVLVRARKVVAATVLADSKADKPARVRLGLRHVDDVLAEAAKPPHRAVQRVRRMIPVNTKRTEWVAAVFKRTTDPVPTVPKPTISPRTADRPPYARGGLFHRPHRRFLFSARQSDLDELLNEAKNSEEKAKKAMVDAARLADELRAEQDHAQTQEKLRKALETQIKELQVSACLRLEPLSPCTLPYALL